MDSPPETPQNHKSNNLQPIPPRLPRSTRISIGALLALVGLLGVVLTAQLFAELSQHEAEAAQNTEATTTAQLPLLPSPTIQSDDNDLFQFSGKKASQPLQVAGDQYAVYEAQDGLYAVQLSGGTPMKLDAPGYMYNLSITPQVTPVGQILYVGNEGIWLSNIFGGFSKQVESVASDQVVTSLILSRDGRSLAWSTVPKSGNGTVNIYEGLLGHGKLVYQRLNSNCPCYRAFSFLEGDKQQEPQQLLLTDDRGDPHAAQYGLWSLNLPSEEDPTLAEDPILLLGDDTSQMPLLITPNGGALLYSTYSGVVPAPTDNSVPGDIASQNNPNSLALATLGGQDKGLEKAQVLLPEQHGLDNTAEYHWVMSPRLSTDGHTLVYAIFSSDDQAPFTRHSALYTTQVKTKGGQVHAETPGVLALTTARFVELGPWASEHVLTCYADNALYAMDVTTGAMQTVFKGSGYMRIVATVERGPE
ncbi:hypothetical protein [Ktedonospora formicarum]|nr:hypothetical protein [Ktedonospora formicarum]